jgi:hypothetical protein
MLSEERINMKNIIEWEEPELIPLDEDNLIMPLGFCSFGVRDTATCNCGLRIKNDCHCGSRVKVPF